MQPPGDRGPLVTLWSLTWSLTSSLTARNRRTLEPRVAGFWPTPPCASLVEDQPRVPALAAEESCRRRIEDELDRAVVLGRDRQPPPLVLDAHDHTRHARPEVRDGDLGANPWKSSKRHSVCPFGTTPPRRPHLASTSPNQRRHRRDCSRAARRSHGHPSRPCSSAPLTLASSAFRRYRASASALANRPPGAPRRP